ncbi:hypothetical protein Gotur_031759 [Gossypium turneri]
MKIFTLNLMTTPEYNWWRGKRVNDNIPMPGQENTRPIEEHLQVEEEKIGLGLDIDIYKLEADKLRKGKNKTKEDLDSLKTDYKKLRLSIRTAGLRVRVAELEKSLHQYHSRNSAIELRANLSKIEELKGKIGELKDALQNCELRVKFLEKNNEHWQEQLHRSQVQANILSLKYESDSDCGRELACLIRKLIAGGHDKGKSPMIDSGDDHEDHAYPPTITPTNIQARPDVYPQRVPVTIRSQYQASTLTPMNFPTGSGSNLRDNPTNPVVPDLDDVMGIVKFDDPSGPNVTENSLPNHSDKGVNAIIENSEERPKGARKYCVLHVEEGYDIQECTEFKTTVQNLMDDMEMEFYEEIKGSEKGEFHASEDGLTEKAQKMIVGKEALPGKRLEKCLQVRVEVPMLMDKRDHFGLGYKPDAKQRRKETFVSEGTIHPERKMSRKETAKEMLGNLSINAISEEGIREENLSGICPYEPGSVLNNWTMEEIPLTFRANSKSSDINDMSNTATDSGSPFE